MILLYDLTRMGRLVSTHLTGHPEENHSGGIPNFAFPGSQIGMLSADTAVFLLAGLREDGYNDVFDSVTTGADS